MSESTDICSAGLILLELTTGQIIPYVWMNRKKSLDAHHPDLDWLFSQFRTYFDQTERVDNKETRYKKAMITDAFKPGELQSRCIVNTKPESRTAGKVMNTVVFPAMHRDAEKRCSLASMKKNLKEAMSDIEPESQQRLHLKRKRCQKTGLFGRSCFRK
ncbi:hypothetical protein [Endozoicomonas numazuensis]|nr:hypothetical protein [Endozoicomonas numazuensis]